MVGRKMINKVAGVRRKQSFHIDSERESTFKGVVSTTCVCGIYYCNRKKS